MFEAFEAFSNFSNFWDISSISTNLCHLWPHAANSIERQLNQLFPIHWLLCVNNIGKTVRPLVFNSLIQYLETEFSSKYTCILDIYHNFVVFTEQNLILLIGTDLSTCVLIWFLSDQFIMQNIHHLLILLIWTYFSTYVLIFFKSCHSDCKTITVTGIPPILVYAHLVALKLAIFEVTNLSLSLHKVIHIFDLISIT